MRIKLIVLLTLTAIIGIACNQKQTTGPSGEKKKIGVTLLTREHQFYKDLEAGLKEAADKNGFELIVQSGDMDLAKQQSQIENFIVQKVAAIVVCPADTKGIGPAIEKANAAKIPVFTADIAASGGTVVSHIASDNLQGGKVAAEFIAGLLKDGGEVGVIGQPEVQSTIDREKGFKDEMAKYPNIKIVATLNGGGVRDRATKATDDMLQGNPNLKAIFAINDDSALGALASAETRGKKDLIIVGYDATPEAVGKIKAGTMLKADVAQDPKLIGSKTIETIAKHLKGETVEKIVAIPVTIVK
ncbi:MAG: substrate-binding domain-containing protein [Acidobacteria bacterium]|nr:substrate-binding domain-containing protein [Acidobacteriota bacterium]